MLLMHSVAFTGEGTVTFTLLRGQDQGQSQSQVLSFDAGTGIVGWWGRASCGALARTGLTCEAGWEGRANSDQVLQEIVL